LEPLTKKIHTQASDLLQLYLLLKCPTRISGIKSESAFKSIELKILTFRRKIDRVTAHSPSYHPSLCLNHLATEAIHLLRARWHSHSFPSRKKQPTLSLLPPSLQ